MLGGCSGGNSSRGSCGGGRAASVVIIAVRVGVGVTVVIAVGPLCFGLQRFRLKRQRLDDSTRLLCHLHLGGIGGGRGVIQQRGAAREAWRFRGSAGLVGREAGRRFRT